MYVKKLRAQTFASDRQLNLNEKIFVEEGFWKRPDDHIQCYWCGIKRRVNFSKYS